MNLKIVNISKRLCVVETDSVKTEIMDNKEASELAMHLIKLAAELLNRG